MADNIHTYSDDPSRPESAHRHDGGDHPREERVAVHDGEELGRADRPATIKRIAWGAVFAGALIAAVTQVTLNLLGLSIGLGTIDPVVEADAFSGLGIGAGIWVAACTIIAFFLGGLVASRLAGLPDRKDGVLHGILAWGLVSIVTLVLMWSAVGSIFNTATNALGQALAAVDPATGQVQVVEENIGPGGVSLDALVSDLIDQLQQSVTGLPGTAAGDEAALRQAINAYFTPGNDVSDRQALIELLAARTDMTEVEARQTVEQYDEEFQELQQTTVEAGGTVAEALSRAAFWAFIASIVGVVAAAIGGAVGVPKDLPARVAIRRE